MNASLKFILRWLVRFAIIAALPYGCWLAFKQAGAKTLATRRSGYELALARRPVIAKQS